MLTVTHIPATTVCGTDEYEATYWLGSCSFATCVRACPLEACAEACGSALFWLWSKYLPRDAAKEA